MDRVFVWTGGHCIDDTGSDTAGSGVTYDDVGSAKCRSIGGTWEGGQDPSGHLFLIAQGSLVLWYEVVLCRLKSGLGNDEIFPLSENESERVGSSANENSWGLGFVEFFSVSLITVFWVMMIVTNLYFHSLLESLAGLAAGYAVIVPVYVFRTLY